MEFKYNGKIYDTAVSHGEHSTNQLQLTEDKGLQKALINAWFEDDKYVAELLAKNELGVIFQYVLIMAKNQDIIAGVTHERVTEVGTYPDWVMESAQEASDDDMKMDITDIVRNSATEHEALETIKERYYRPDEW